MANGEKIVFPKQSDQSPDASPGDVVFVVNAEPHPVFRRRGINLYMSMTISLAEALLGFERKIKHLDGSMVSVERRTVTQPGFTLTLPEEGMPKHDFPSERGDLFIEFQIVLPSDMEHLKIGGTDSAKDSKASEMKKQLIDLLYGDEYQNNEELKAVIDKVMKITSKPHDGKNTRHIHLDEDEDYGHDEL